MASPCPKRFYTLEEVKRHDSLPDLWMIIYNKVYNVSSLVHSHPGGPASILECGGIDATEVFEDVAHSDDALRMLGPHCIGDINPLQSRTYPNLRRQPGLIQEISPDADRLHSDHSRSKSPTTSRSDTLFLSILGFLALFVIISLIYIHKIKWAGDSVFLIS